MLWGLEAPFLLKRKGRLKTSTLWKFIVMVQMVFPLPGHTCDTFSRLCLARVHGASCFVVLDFYMTA